MSDTNRLSTNFTLTELTRTSSGIPNTINIIERRNLQSLVDNILQPARDRFGGPIMVNSGFRNEAVNRAVGGATTSQHRLGQAADIRGSDNARIFNIIRDNLPFDQLIWELGNDQQPQWIHVSFSDRHRREVLRATMQGGRKVFTRM